MKICAFQSHQDLIHTSNSENMIVELYFYAALPFVPYVPDVARALDGPQVLQEVANYSLLVKEIMFCKILFLETSFFMVWFHNCSAERTRLSKDKGAFAKSNKT